jgi:hypothetical protein
MNWNQRTAIRILLFVARMLADTEWKEEIGHISNHIMAHREEQVQ